MSWSTVRSDMRKLALVGVMALAVTLTGCGMDSGDLRFDSEIELLGYTSNEGMRAVGQSYCDSVETFGPITAKGIIFASADELGVDKRSAEAIIIAAENSYC